MAAIALNRTPEKTRVQRRFVSEKVVSEVTGRSRRTLQKDRLLGTGPFPHYSMKRQIVYDLSECISIIEASRSGDAA